MSDLATEAQLALLSSLLDRKLPIIPKECASHLIDFLTGPPRNMSRKQQVFIFALIAKLPDGNASDVIAFLKQKTEPDDGTPLNDAIDAECATCGPVTVLLTDEGERIRGSCAGCGTYIKWMPRSREVLHVLKLQTADPLMGPTNFDLPPWER